MGMVVRTNTMAMNANRQLGINNSLVAKSLEKLSSGFKINRAADDASGLAISEKMKAQIKGLETASANSQDGISLVQTAEGGAQEIHDMLNRMVELATKSANGTIQDDVDREAIQREVDDLNAEITRIAKSTNFNGIDLLNGNLSAQGIGGVSGSSGLSPEMTAVNMKAHTTAADAITGQQTKATGNTTKVGVSGTIAAGKNITLHYTNQNGENKTISLTTGSGVGALAGAKADLQTQFENIAKGKKADGSADLGNSAADEALKEFASLFDVKIGQTADGSNATMEFTAKTPGNGKAAVTAISTAETDTNIVGSKFDASGNVTLDYDRTKDANGLGSLAAVTDTARDKGYTLTLGGGAGATAITVGDTVKLGGKTFEFVTKADDAKGGNIAVVIAGNTTNMATNAAAASALVQTMKDNGITSATNVDVHGNATNKVFIGDTSQISVKQKGEIAIDSTSDGVHIANQQESGPSYELTIADGNFYSNGAAKVKKGDVLKLKFDYLDENGKLNSIEMDYEVAEDANSNGTNNAHAAASIVAKLNNNKAFAEKFDISNNGGALTLKAKDGAGAADIKVTGLKLEDKAGNDLLVDSGNSGNNLTQSAAPTAAGKTMTLTDDLKVGDSIKIGDKTFTFTDDATKTGLQEDGSVGVLKGTDTAATAKNLDKALKEAFPDLDYNFDAVNKKFTFVDNGKELPVQGEAAEGGLTLQIGDTGDDFNRVTVSVDDLSASGIGTEGLDVSTQTASNKAIDTIKAAINQVSTNRANLGSLQNRLEHTINNLDTTAENMTAANSRIRDTDMAKEMMNYTKMNVLVQAAQAMLAQANQQPQSILQLLQ